MRSTERSDVGDSRFGAIDRRPVQPSEGGFFASIAPFSYFVAAVALTSATLFVVFDWAHAFDQLDKRTALYQQLNAAPIAGDMVANLLLPVVGSIEEPAVSADVLQRGIVAYGLALLMSALALRRRRPLQPTAQSSVSTGELIDSLPFGLACWTAEGRLIACSPQYGARLGEQDVSDLVSDYTNSIRGLALGGTTEVVREDTHGRMLEVRRKDGSCLLVDERRLPSGGFVTLVTDVTESRRAESLLTSIREEQRVLARRYHEEKLRAEAASRAKTSFLAHLSHDIRTPLNAIIGFAELMRQETYGSLGDPRYDGYVDSIKASGERLLGFFSSILDLAELEGGRRVLENEDIGVDDLLETLAVRFSGQARQARLSIRIGPRCGAHISGDRFSLERMLGNLIDNAIRFTPAGGRVTIAAYAAVDGVVLEVSDTGIGMGPERLALVSQPFAFGDSALSKDREGAGLGLAIARTIVELSGGHLAIDSREGLGTTVAVSLPLKAIVPVNVAA